MSMARVTGFSGFTCSKKVYFEVLSCIRSGDAHASR